MTNTMDLPKRIERALACLPDVPYREMLQALFANLTAERDADKEYIRQLEDAVTPELVELRNERDTASRKLAALSNINAMENLYQCGIEQEREIKVLTERVKAVEPDAGRYRWLLANGLFAQSQGYDTQIGIAGILFVNDIDTPDPSAAIDAAIKGTP